MKIQAEGLIMTRTLALGRFWILGVAGLTLLASAGAALACPYGDKSAQTTTSQQQTSDSTQLPLPPNGTNGDGTTGTGTPDSTGTGSKTGG